MGTLFKTLAAAAAIGCFTFATPSPAPAAPTDPAAVQVQTFDDALLDVMKQAKTLGAEGRYRKLEPAVERAFDLPAMTQFAVGPSWATMSEADRQALIKAFARFTVASYAHGFDSYNGQQIALDPDVKARGADKVVQTHMSQPGGDPTDFTYRMRQSSDGSWKIIDVYYGGAISQLAMRRSEFASSLASGGAPNLVKHLNALSASLMK